MHPFFEKLEKTNARLIPYALVLLLAIIVLELTYHSESPIYNVVISIADYLVVLVFVIDLVFIAHRCRDARYFFKNYYLDILAVFPFTLIFRFVGEAYQVFRIGEELAVGQSIFHETLEAEKGLTKAGRIARYFKIVVRSLRIVTKSRFLTKVHHHKDRDKIGKRKKGGKRKK